MPIERAQVQGCYGNITIRHTLVKTAILHYKRPRVGNNLQPTVVFYNLCNFFKSRIFKRFSKIVLLWNLHYLKPRYAWTHMENWKNQAISTFVQQRFTANIFEKYPTGYLTHFIFPWEKKDSLAPSVKIW